MKRIVVCVYPILSNIETVLDDIKYDQLISVDQATHFLIEKNIPISLAIGDFDSIKDKIVLNDINHITLNVEKDETDTLAAIRYAYQQNPDEVIVLGGIGGERIEHSIANISLLNEFPNLKIITDYSKIYTLSEGTYQTSFKGYISIFSMIDSVISLKNFKYPLNQYELTLFNTIGISNELNGDIGTIEVKKGKIMVIESKK
ncbi:thiamine diphosphokinase [Acholeplasma equifetale]|uniref:thiamine diphosphokinase n=1 Tax=Acholeplasma equifetale TaxID=264634 RepID=UPI00047BC97E|nr:thiamine diphosphokinase [Acholeplasma equifetale]